MCFLKSFQQTLHARQTMITMGCDLWTDIVHQAWKMDQKKTTPPSTTTIA